MKKYNVHDKTNRDDGNGVDSCSWQNAKPHDDIIPLPIYLDLAFYRFAAP
jgi:hypothetical protein